MEGSILQWNIRGLRGNLEQLHLLIRTFIPAVLVLQETLIYDKSPCGISGYNHSIFLPVSEHCRGVSIYTHHSILTSPVQLNTNLNAVACTVSLHKTITVCSIYLSPSVSVKVEDLENLIDQLPRPFLLLGDFNGHSPVWGSDRSSPRGLMLESLFSELDLCVLNDGSNAHFYSANGSFSCIDLSVCDPSMIFSVNSRARSREILAHFQTLSRKMKLDAIHGSRCP